MLDVARQSLEINLCIVGPNSLRNPTTLTPEIEDRFRNLLIRYLRDHLKDANE